MKADVRSPKILIINFPTRLNLGCYALLQGTISLLRGSFPAADIIVHSPWGADCISDVPVKDSLVTHQGGGALSSNIVFKLMVAPFRLLRYLISRKKSASPAADNDGSSPIRDYTRSDLVVNTGGDLLTEDYGPVSLFFWTYHIAVALLLRRRVILMGESLGPFRHPMNRLIMGLILRRCDLLLVREPISMEIAVGLGIPRDNILKMPDPSLAIGCIFVEGRPSVAETVAGSRRGIIIAPSSIAWKYSIGSSDLPDSRYANYIESLCAIVNRFLENGIDVRLLPHVRGPESSSDDLAVCQEVADRVASPSVTVLRDVNTPEGVRSAIRNCELLIAFRMHAALAGFATCTPTVSIGYSHKFDGISRDITGSAEWFQDIRRIRIDEQNRHILVDRIWSNWLDKDSQSRILTQRIGGLCEELTSGVNRIQRLWSEHG